jgi:hypothetical protein
MCTPVNNIRRHPKHRNERHRIRLLLPVLTGRHVLRYFAAHACSPATFITLLWRDILFVLLVNSTIALSVNLERDVLHGREAVLKLHNDVGLKVKLKSRPVD